MLVLLSLITPVIYRLTLLIPQYVIKPASQEVIHFYKEDASNFLSGCFQPAPHLYHPYWRRSILIIRSSTVKFFFFQLALFDLASTQQCTGITPTDQY
jgi:hypothetical protein